MQEEFLVLKRNFYHLKHSFVVITGFALLRAFNHNVSVCAFRIENHLKNFQEAMEKQRLTYADDMNSVREQYQLDLNLMMATVEGIKKAISGE